MSQWFEKVDGTWYLTDDAGVRDEVPNDPLPFKLPQLRDEWNRIRTFRQRNGGWAGTLLGDSLAHIISDAAIIEHNEIMALAFASVAAADRQLFPYLDPGFKRTCLRRVDEFYQHKEYQRYLSLHETNGYSDHILRPIVMIVNGRNVIESVPSYEQLMRKRIIPIPDCQHQVYSDKLARLDVRWTLEGMKKLLRQQNIEI